MSDPAETPAPPAVGTPAPDFTRPALAPGVQGETAVTLSDVLAGGNSVVLYFYPKDATPGCTTEACDFRDAHADLAGAGAAVLGVSPDPVASHAKFAAKHDLPFPLLADEDHAVAEAYGVWVEKSMYGKTYHGVRRATFLIAPDGTVNAAWPKVTVKGHVAAVRAAVGL